MIIRQVDCLGVTHNSVKTQNDLTEYVLTIVPICPICPHTVQSPRARHSHILARQDVGVVFLNTVLVVLGYAVAAEQPQIQYCLGVMVFTISRQLFAIAQRRFDNDIIHCFAITATVAVVLLYDHNKYTRPLFFLCVNCISLAWTLLIEVWIASFHGALEPFIIYFVIFVLVETCHDWAVLALDVSKGAKSDHVLYSYEAFVIAHEASSEVGLPSTPDQRH
jgi:hypothetical protein